MKHVIDKRLVSNGHVITLYDDETGKIHNVLVPFDAADKSVSSVS